MTTITSIEDYVTRARAILLAFNPTGTDVTAGADMAVLPAYEVFLKSGSHEREGGARKRHVTRILSIRVYYYRVEDASKEVQIRVARAAAQGAIESYVDAIFNRPNLSLNDGGKVITGDVEDSLGLMPYGSNVYFGFDIDIQLLYNRG
jgi:hypothetical protein